MPDEIPVVTRLVLVRHGESNVTVDGVIGGHRGCTGLSPLGVAQAEALRGRLARTGEVVADALMASVLPRAIETAEIIAPALGGLVPEQDCDLCELHPGESDGLTWEEHRVLYRPEGWTWSPHVPLAPGAESWVGFQERVARTLARIAAEHRGRTVVIACHGGVVDSSLAVFLGLPFHGRLSELRTRNTSLTEWELHEADQLARGPARWRLIRYNDASHLADLQHP